MAYAAKTKVSVNTTRVEIEDMLTRYGAEQFAIFVEPDIRAVVRFTAHNRMVQFVVNFPLRSEFARTPTGRARSRNQVDQEHAAGMRSMWRRLLLVIKAKMEAVESGITTFEQEFLAHTLLPSGETVGEWIEPQIDAAYDSGRMPSVLPQIGTGS